MAITPNNSLIGIFSYKGMIPIRSCLTISSALPDLPRLPVIQFVRAAQNGFAATQVNVDIYVVDVVDRCRLCICLTFAFRYKSI